MIFNSLSYTPLILIATTVPLILAASDDRSPQALYQMYCAQCHGDKMQGGMASAFDDGIWSYGQGSNIYRNIFYGIEDSGMPAYQDVMSADEARALAEYLLQVQKNSGATPPPLLESVQTDDYFLQIQVMAEDLQTPWAVAFINTNHALITEKNGNLRQWINGRLLPDPVVGTPPVNAAGQGGMMEVTIDPGYEDNGWIYLGYTHALQQDSRDVYMTRIERGRIIDNRWSDAEVIFQAPDDQYLTTRHHYGTRIVFDADGYLYFAIGDRGHMDNAQNLSLVNGKIHRIHSDGRIPNDNPFAAQPDAMPSIWTYGNRNPQGISVHPANDQIWSVEHGPMGGDELNWIRPGLNYGWPLVTHGINYNGKPISDKTEAPGLESPVIHWTPSIAVCAAEFYHGTLFPKWNHNLFVTALRYQELRRLVIENQEVIRQEIILKNQGRVRDVAINPDGSIWAVLNQPDRVIRLTPQTKQ